MAVRVHGKSVQGKRSATRMYLPGSPTEALEYAVVGGLCLSLEAVACGRATELVLTVGNGLTFSVADSGAFPS